MKNMSFFNGLGIDPKDKEEIVLQKNFLVYLAVFMSLGGLVWGGLSLYYGLSVASLFPFGYLVISFVNIGLFAQHKDMATARVIQIFISLFLPLGFQFLLGGFGPSGGVALWSVLALVGSSTFRSTKESIGWTALFLVGMLLSLYFNNTALSLKPEILPEFSPLLMVINISMISVIIFLLTLFYVNEQNKSQVRLNNVLSSLQTNEESIRELAERQLEDAEKLMLSQKEMKKKNVILLKSRAHLQQITKKQLAINEKLVRAQKQVKAQESRFRRVVENAPLIILTINKEGVIEFADGSGLVVLGLSQTQLIGQKAVQFFGLDESIQETIAQAFQGAPVVVNQTLNGFVFEVHLTPVKEDGGETSLLCVATDITEKVKAQTELETALERAKNSEKSIRAVAEEQLMQSEKLMLAERELQKTLEEVQRSKSQLEETQTQLVNNEKMASLGQLTAGIAHEINNPINFIYNGIDTLTLTLDEIMQVVNKVKLLNLTSSDELVKEIVELKQTTDLNELTEDMNALIDDIKNGAIRTMEIVKGLRVFSRLDEEDQKMANINENMDATLVLLRNKTKNRIEVRKFYDPTLGEIMCYPGQLNQVFMNIISNAIQAMPEDTKDGKIMIYTENKESDVIIRIKDNGTGMSEEIKKRIFEPFYTTKAVGVGTGLGLSISYGIIEKHNGEIYVNSEIGKGTEFVITLPKS